MSNRSVLSARSKARLTGFLATGRLVRKHGRMVAIGSSLLMAAGIVFAKGGTAKPPVVSGLPNGVVFPVAGPLLPSFSTLAFPAVGSTGDVGFSVSGHAQAVSLTGGACTGVAGDPQGGTVTINGVVINVPANTIVQFPANTTTFADAICPANLEPNPAAPAAAPPFSNFAPYTPATFAPTQMSTILPTGPGPVIPAVEFSIDGNILGGGVNAGVGSTHIAALISVSQQSLNSGAGFIQRIDYTDGSIYVSSGAGGVATRLQLADPTGRFGRPQTGPDVRFSVDAANPTVKSGATGYPMCIPRSAPSGIPGVETDPQCPQANRPTGACRTFAAPSAAGTAGLSGLVSLSAGGTAPFAGFRIPGADVSPTPPVPGGFCTGFVMPALAGYPGAIAAAAISPANVTPLAAPGGAVPPGTPDPREQAPFEVGDFIQWAGTLVRGGNTPPAAGDITATGDVVWAHTIEANVGIYTQPATLPAYIAIGENGIGVDPQSKNAIAAGVPGVESTARIFFESNTSDVSTLVDVYFDDKGFTPTPAPFPAGGPRLVPTAFGPGGSAEYFRWITTEGMTGSLAFQTAFTNQGGAAGLTSQPYPVSAQPFGGGIQTAYVGPQPGRARMRANNVPPIDPTRLNACPVGGAPGTLTAAGDQGCAVTQSPTRFIRATLRSLCAPAITTTNPSANPALAGGLAAGVPIPPGNIDNGLVAGPGAWIDVNAPRVGPLAAPTLPGAGPGAAIYPADAPSTGLCFERAQFANGLFSGQYSAPVGEFIFPENTLAGVPVVPATTWQLGFVVYGEGSSPVGSTGASIAPPAPTPF